MRQPWEQDPEAWKEEDRTLKKKKIAVLFACRIKEFNISIEKLNAAFQHFSDMARVLELIHGHELGT